MHALRKRAKDHWYHVRLLRDLWPATMTALADELDRLGDLLGDDHDLAIFRGALDRLAGDGDPSVAGDLRDLAARRRAELQAAGLGTADRAFAGKPGGTANRMAALWTAWRRNEELADPADAEAEAATPSPRTWGGHRSMERTFVVTGEAWREAVSEARHIRQGHLADPERIGLRVRIIDDEEAELTVKGVAPGPVCTKIKLELAIEDARALMELATGAVVEKVRHLVPVDGLTVAVEEFRSPEAGLVIARVEPGHPDAALPAIDWLGPEVTGNAEFEDASLAATGR